MSIIHIPIFEIKGEILVNSTSSGGEITPPDKTPILVKKSNPNGILLTDANSAQWYCSDGKQHLISFQDVGMGIQWTMDGNPGVQFDDDIDDNKPWTGTFYPDALRFFASSVTDEKISCYRLYIPEHYEDPDTHEWVNGHWFKWKELGEVAECDIVLPDNMKYEDGKLYVRNWGQGEEIEEPIEPGVCSVKNSTDIPLILKDANNNELTLDYDETKELQTGYYIIVDAPFAGIEIGDGNIYEMNGSLPISGNSIDIKQHVYEIPDDLFAQIEREYPIPEPVEVPEEEPVEQPEHDRYYDPDFPYGDKSAFKIYSDSTYHTFTFKLLDIEQENATATIDWGDGETTTISTGINTNVSHRYSKTGLYIITIDNTIDAISVTGQSYLSQIMLWEVYQLGDSITALFDFCFNGSNITHIELPTNLIEIGMHSFDNCKYLKTINFSGMKAPRLHDASIFNTTMGSDVIYKNEMKLILPYDSEGYEDEGSPWIDILVNQCGYKLEHAYFKKYVDVKKLEEEMVMNADIPDEGDDSDEIIKMYEKPYGEDNAFPEPDYELEGVDCQDYLDRFNQTA